MKKTLVKAAATSLALAFATGCGMTQMPGKIDTSNANMNDMKSKMDASNQNMSDMKVKMDATNQAMADMKAKMDATNSTMTQMKSGMDQSNSLQSQLLSQIQTSNQTQQQLLAGIQASNTTQTQLLSQIQASNQTQLLIKAAVDMTNSKMEVTNKAIHLQTLAQAETGLFSDSATAYLSPVPIDMVPFGQTLAAALQENEFAPLEFGWFQDANAPMDPAHLPGGKSATQVDHDMLVRLWAFRIVAGTAPQDLIAQTFDTEFVQGGPQSDIVPFIMAARWDFIYNVLLNMSLFTVQLDNPGKLLLAKNLASALDYIDNLPNLPAANLELAVGGMLNPADNVDLKVDPSKVDTVWARIAAAFKAELAPQYQALLTSKGPDTSGLQQLQADVLKRVKPPAAAPSPAPSQAQSPQPAQPTQPQKKS